MDKITLTRIQLLHPAVRDSALRVYELAEDALAGTASLRFAQTLRTFEDQAVLYSQGRTIEGPVVTDAVAGKSWHNYGLAFDIVLMIKDATGKVTATWDMRTDFDGDKVPDWKEVVNIAKAEGWAWGGDWKKPDNPHFDKTFDLKISTALARYNKRDFIPGTKYIRI